MSTQGTSGDGQGSGIGDGRGGWASPLGQGLPDPHPIQDGERGAREAGAAREERADGVPSGGGQGGEGGRGAQPQPGPGPEGGESDVTPGDQATATAVSGAAVTSPSGAVTFLETPRGREMFQDFLAQLAQQPAPGEAAELGSAGSTQASGTSGTAAPMTTSTARPSLPTTLPTTQQQALPSGVPMVTPTPVPGGPVTTGGSGPTQARGAGGQGAGGQGPVRVTGMPLPGPLPVTGSAWAAGPTTVATGAYPGSAGMAPAQTTGTATGGAGTTTTNPALQTFLMDALNQALRMYASRGVPSATVQPPPAAVPTAQPASVSSGQTPQVGTASGQVPGGYGSMFGAATPMAMPPAPAYTPSGVSRAAIPSYGGVSINVPSAASGNAGMGRLPPGAFYPPFQPAMVATPAWGAALGSALPQVPYGGQPMTTGSQPTPDAYQFGSQGGGPGPQATAGFQPRNYPVIGIPNELRNAVKVIVPFHSESASSERAAAFWRCFEKCTFGMDDQMRLTAFEQCLKGKVGLEWWYNSRIDSFEALRVRFHNRFICQTPAQLWNRLKTAKRNKGESAEEWGGRISTMCEALNYNEPRMRFEFFLDGLRNKQMRAMLNSSMVTSIPEAYALLLYKNLHLPVEEDDEFVGDGTSRVESKKASSTQSQMLLQLQQLNQRLMQPQNAGTPPSGQINAVAPTLAAVQFPSGNAGTQRGPLQIRLAPDTRTTEGGVVCGRCVRAGHGRELCPRRHSVCNRCGDQGHYLMECNVSGQARNYKNGERRPTTCFFCGVQGHSVAKCPGIEQLRGLMTAAAAGTAATTTQSQQ